MDHTLLNLAVTRHIDKSPSEVCNDNMESNFLTIKPRISDIKLPRISTDYFGTLKT